MSEQRRHHDFSAWKEAMELVAAVYKLSDVFPPTERNGLTADLRRCVTQVPSLLAEGSARTSRYALVQSVDAARGALAQVETQLAIAYRLDFVGPNKDIDERIPQLFEKLGGMSRVLLAEHGNKNRKKA
ncbi:MAG: four helix bundle protein [Oceanococcus sp.]